MAVLTGSFSSLKMNPQCMFLPVLSMIGDSLPPEINQ